MRLRSVVTHSGPSTGASRSRAILSAFLILSLGAAPGEAQLPTTQKEWMPWVQAGGEDERYLRYLQIAGLVPAYPWSSRGLSPRETEALPVSMGTHPWTGAFPFESTRHRLFFLPTTVEARHNSGFPYGGNDGAVWAGRGVTGSISAGVLLRLGTVSLVVAPTAFIAQNESFTLLDNGQAGALRFADPVYFNEVDLPQRFGEGSYGRVDHGQSTLRADVGPIAAGVSGANLIWGPSTEYPFILGTNAPGFAHLFLGTARPLDLWLVKIHGRLIWGRLEQSEYSSVTGSETYRSVAEPGRRRFASGMLLTLMPRGTQGLELGLARFFHSLWPESGIAPSQIRKPFQGFVKRGLRDTPGFPDVQGGGDNQLFSLFARWAFQRARTEVYAEYGRDDHSYDRRDLLQEPDHSRAYGLGIQHVTAVSGESMSGVRFELINFQLPPLARTGRGEGGIYVHGVMRQGHTNRGQLLGAAVAVGSGAGSLLAWDKYTPAGRMTYAVRRTVRRERGSFFLDGAQDPDASDVQYAIEAERLRRYARIELTTRLSLIREFNRDFGDDAWSTSVSVGARVPFARMRSR